MTNNTLNRLFTISDIKARTLHCVIHLTGFDRSKQTPVLGNKLLDNKQCATEIQKITTISLSNSLNGMIGVSADTFQRAVPIFGHTAHPYGAQTSRAALLTPWH
jgi:hypothetical protein